MNQAVLILDRYEPVEVAVGEGASGIVTKARDTFDTRLSLVAIKRPNSTMMSPAEAQKKNDEIRREAKALRRLDHFATCQFIDAGEWPDSSSGYETDYYVVTAWAEGNQLEFRLRQLESTGQILPYGEALEILDQLADVLAHAHHNSVVHNDIDAKHLFWNQQTRQLKLIDWANCALLDTGEKPAANITELNDLQQFGELMHRILTGSTLHVAERLGGGKDWQVEMRDKKIANALQTIVAKAIQRSNEPYQVFQPLADDLHRFKETAHKPYEARVREIDALISQARASIDRKILIKAGNLIESVSEFDPSLVIGYQQDLLQLRQAWDEHAAIATAKAAMMNDRWTIANQRIENVFGPDPETMPVEARRIRWYCLMMAEAEADTEAYSMRKEALEALFLNEAKPETKFALTCLLLSYGTDQPDHNALIEDLYQDTEDGYPTWQGQLSVSRRRLETLPGLTVPEQIEAYRELQQAAKVAQGSENAQLRRVISLLTKANSSAEEDYDYPAARKYFQRAFFLDPANYHIFYLSELMIELAEIAQLPPSSRKYEDLYQNQIYQFPAATQHIERAKHKIATVIGQGIRDTRRGRLEIEREKRERLEREKSDVLLQRFWLMRDSYRALYDEANGVEVRLRGASRLMDKAKSQQPTTSFADLDEELGVLEGILNTRAALFEQGLGQIEAIAATLPQAPHQDNHALIMHLQQELGLLNAFKETCETALSLFVDRHYEEAIGVWQHASGNFDNGRAFEWLNPAKSPSKQKWAQFCHNIQQGLIFWHDRDYSSAHSRFSAAQQGPPAGATGKVPAKLEADLETILVNLDILRAEISEGQKTLQTAADYGTVQSIAGNLKTALKSEKAIINIIGGKPQFTTSIALAQAFISYSQQDDFDGLFGLLKQGRHRDDPLFLEYHEAVLRRKSITILMIVRAGKLDLAEKQIKAEIDAEGKLPRILADLEIIRQSYAMLTDSPEQVIARDRIERAKLNLERTSAVIQTGDPTQLSDEISIVSELTSLYQGVNEQGANFHEEASARVERLKTGFGLDNKHKFVRKFEVELDALTVWYDQREGLVKALSRNELQHALELIQNTPERTRHAVLWLDEKDQPDWAGWEAFIGALITIWSGVDGEPDKHDLQEAGHNLSDLSLAIPGGLTVGMAVALKEKFDQDAVQLQTELRKLEAKTEATQENLVSQGLQHLHEGDLSAALQLAEYASTAGSLACLRNLCMGYEQLYDEQKALTAQARIDSAQTALEQAKQQRATQAVANALNKEQVILQRLIELYEQIHAKIGPEADLTEAIGKIQESPAVKYLRKCRSHFFVSKSIQQLAFLEQWIGHRHHVAELWSLGQYNNVLQELAQIESGDETVLAWVDDALQKDWEDWQLLSGLIKRGLTSWQAYDFEATANWFNKARECIPKGLPPETAASLAKNLTAMAADLTAIGHRLKSGQTLLQEAEQFYQDASDFDLIRKYMSWETFRYSLDILLFDPVLYGVVDTQLRVAQSLERKWPEAAGQTIYVDRIFERYRRFTGYATDRQLEQLQKVVEEDFGRQDPLQTGYQHVEGLIDKGLRSDASQQDYAIAQRLAPGGGVLQNGKLRQYLRGGILPGCLVLVILIVLCSSAVLVTSIVTPIIWGQDEGAATANDGESPALVSEPVALQEAASTPTATATATLNPTGTATESQLVPTASNVEQDIADTAPTTTPTPISSPSAAENTGEQVTESAGTTPTAAPTAETPPAPPGSPVPTLTPVDLFALAKWLPDELQWARTGPTIYENTDGQWNLRSDKAEGHTFWAQELFQHFPLGLEATVFLARPKAGYGLVLESVDSQQRFALNTTVDPITDEGIYTIAVSPQNETYSQGALLEYSVGSSKNVFEIKVSEDLVEFIVNGQTVDAYEPDQKLAAGWRVGVNIEVEDETGTGTEPLGHLVIDPTDSIKVYQLPPAQ